MTDNRSRIAIAVPAGTMRRVVAGPDGISFLCVGGRPGAVYEPVKRFLGEG